MRKNLIVIVADTLRHPARFADVPLLDVMPFLSSAIPRAVRFEKLLSSSNWTVPSHVSLLTGSDPWSVHISPTGGNYTVPASRSIAHDWERTGGTSALFSANAAVSPDNNTARGYSEVYPRGWGLAGRSLTVHLTTLNERLVERQTGSEIRARAGPAPGPLESAFVFTGYGLHRLHNRFTVGTRVVHDLDRAMKTHRFESPVHLLLNLMETHEPYYPAGVAPGRLVGAGFFPTLDISNYHSFLSERLNGTARLVEAYRQAAALLDRRLADVFEILRRRGFLDRSTVLLVSDHGQCLGEGGFIGHGHEMFDGLVHIPAYLWDPDVQPERVSAAWNAEWIDHRHLRDILLEVNSGGTPREPESIFADVLERRGPAACYWEGGYTRGTPFSAHGAPVRRAVRVVQGDRDVSALLDLDALGRAGEVQMQIESDRFGDLGGRISSILHRPDSIGKDLRAADESDEVAERLDSWGYS